MAALSTDAVSTIDRPRALWVSPGAPDAPPPSPPAPPEPFAWPKNDRLTLRKKVALLSDRGLWRAMDALAARHGWESAEVARFIDAHLPKAACRHCGGLFYAYSRRVKHCSDRCRRLHSAANDPATAHQSAPRLLPPVPAAPRRPLNADDLCVWLHRDAEDPADRRYYLLLIVQDLGGTTALIRQWGRDDGAHPQQVVTHYTTLGDALAARTRFVAIQHTRGYQPATLAPGKGDLLHHAYEAAGVGARQ